MSDDVVAICTDSGVYCALGVSTDPHFVAGQFRVRMRAHVAAAERTSAVHPANQPAGVLRRKQSDPIFVSAMS